MGVKPETAEHETSGTESAVTDPLKNLFMGAGRNEVGRQMGSGETQKASQVACQALAALVSSIVLTVLC